MTETSRAPTTTERRRRRSTLRMRLVAVLVVLVGIGLAGFGLLTTSLYSRTLHNQLDANLRAAVPAVSEELTHQAGIVDPDHDHSQGTGSSVEPGVATEPGGDSGFDAGPSGPSLLIAPGTFGELISPQGKVIARLEVSSRVGRPDVPAPLPSPGATVSTGAASGSSGWRLTTQAGPGGYVTVVAVPTAGIESSMTRLITIEILVGLGLLLLLGVASFLLISRAMAPLESMAMTASAIAEGDLGRRVEVETSASELEDLRRALNAMLDEIEASFAEREATEQRLRQFLADASHELRTPLTSIAGFAEILRLEGADAVDPAHAAGRIEDEAARLARLVDDLLTLARLDEARTPVAAPVDLTVLAADACSDAAAIERGRPLRLTAEQPVVIMGIEDHLRQALGNLLSNALRHTPAGTPIDVTVERSSEGAGIITVRDHGPGIPADQLEQVFDRFFQVDASRAGSGTGLGLSIVQAIATEHGGKASAANEPDGGAAITMVLPGVGASGARMAARTTP